MDIGKETRPFQLILLGIFGFLLVAGAITFATFRASDEDALPDLELWGTISQDEFDSFLTTVSIDLQKNLPITYRGFLEEDFDQALVEALAAGEGPDMILLPQDLIVRYYDKVYILPYSSYSERDFKDTFVEEGELYLTPDGIVGFPFSIDPMVLYWNRTLFSNAGIAQPPQFWDELAGLTDDLTESNQRGDITQSTVAFGTFDNVTHAADILSLLILQAGGDIVSGTADEPSVTLRDFSEVEESAAVATLRFYTEFANPARILYSWNRSLPDSLQAFLAGDLALYPGYASELFVLEEQNPNLNYDVAMIPQVRDGARELTFGTMHGLAVIKQSPHVGASFTAAGILTSPDVLGVWESRTGLPPVRRDMLKRRPTDAFRRVFYDSALVADAFLDPDPAVSHVVFEDMVEDVISGRDTINVSVRNADERLDRALP